MYDSAIRYQRRQAIQRGKQIVLIAKLKRVVSVIALTCLTYILLVLLLSL